MTSEELIRKLKALQDRFEVRLVSRIMLHIQKFASANIRGGLLKVRTGQLYREWMRSKPEKLDAGKMQVLGMSPDRTEGRIGAFLDDGGKTGGDIVPKNAKYLRIPLPPALTPAGADRFPGTLKGRNDLGFFVPKGRNEGNLILMRRIGKKVEPWYLLRRKVHVAPRYWLKEAVESVDFNSISAEVANEVIK